MMYLSKFSCNIDKFFPLESRGKEKSVFGVVNKKDNKGNAE